jgi:hypothetical protein
LAGLIAKLGGIFGAGCGAQALRSVYPMLAMLDLRAVL